MLKKSNDQTLKEVISDLLNAYKLKGKMNEVRLIDSWEKVLGKMIANHTKKLSIKDKKLVVKLDSSVLRHELSFEKEKIIMLLNDEVGERVIEEIKLM